MGNAVEVPARPARSIRQRIILVVFIVLLTGIYTEKHFEPIKGHWDFETFYLIAKMIRSGDGARLYDLSAQAAYQMRYIDPARRVNIPDLPFLYPAATGVLFLPFAWVPRSLAFSIWTAISLTLLVVSIRILQRQFPIPQDDGPVFAALLFMPVYVCLLHGQVSILMLFLCVLAFSWFKRGNPFLAGIALGLGTLKFQLVLGFYGVLLLRRCWKALAGVAVGAVPVALVSAAVLGWRGALHYPLTLMQSAHVAKFDTAQTMISAYGLLTGVIGHPPPAWLLATVSAAIIAAAAVVRGDEDVAFSAATVAAILVSYHAFLQEFTLLLLPAAVIASRIERTSRLVMLSGALLVAIAVLVFFGETQIAAVVTYLATLFGLWYAKSRAGLQTEAAGLHNSAQKTSA